MGKDEKWLIDECRQDVFFIGLEQALVAAFGACMIATFLGIEMVLSRGATDHFTALRDTHFLDDGFWCFHFRHRGGVIN